MQAILPFLEAGVRYVQIHGNNDELDELPDASDVDWHCRDADTNGYNAVKNTPPRYQQLSQALRRDDPLSPGLIDRVFQSPSSSNALETEVHHRLSSIMEDVEDAGCVEDTEDVEDGAHHMNVKNRRSKRLSTCCDQNGKIFWPDLSDDDTLYKAVSVRERSEAFVHHYGTRDTRDPNNRWTIDIVGASFRDLCNNINEFCLINGKEIESGAGYHCKGGVVACKSCRVALIMKQLGGAMTKKYNEIENGTYETNHFGGIPKMLLDIAKKLPISWLDGREEAGFISSLDYRNLELMILALTHRASCGYEINISSFTKLWRICQCGLEPWQYLEANKRFIGCLLDIDRGSKSDDPKHDESKPLANLWHPTAVWRNEKHLSFTTKYPYGTGRNERDNYNQDVIYNSILHIKTYDKKYKELANSVWEELMNIRRSLDSLVKKVKRKENGHKENGHKENGHTEKRSKCKQQCAVAATSLLRLS